MKYLKKYEEKLILEDQEVEEVESQEIEEVEEETEGGASVNQKVFEDFLSQMSEVVSGCGELSEECSENPDMNDDDCEKLTLLCSEMSKSHELVKWSIENNSPNLEAIGLLGINILRQYSEAANGSGFQDYAIPAIRAIQEWNKATGQDVS